MNIRQLNPDEIAARSPELQSLYAEVYREPPYQEGPEMAADFIAHLDEHRHQPGFTMLVAEDEQGLLLGMAYGFTFPADRWWSHAGSEPEETKGRPKFAILEFVVRPHARGQRIGSALMSTLHSNRSEPFATLSANPAATARVIYDSWGWKQVGTSNPAAIGPMDVLILPLNSGEIRL